MAVQLDKIHFYRPPSLPKPPPSTQLAASRKSSPQIAPVAQSFLHALPPKPPVPAPAAHPGALSGAAESFDTHAPCSRPRDAISPLNLFDLELERISALDTAPMVCRSIKADGSGRPYSVSLASFQQNQNPTAIWASNLGITRARCKDGSLAGPLGPCPVDNPEAPAKGPVLPESLPGWSSHAPTPGPIIAASQGVSGRLPAVANGDVKHSDTTVIRNIMPPSPILPITTSHVQGPTQSSSHKDQVMHGSPGAEAAVPMDQERMTMRKANTVVDDSSCGDNNPTTESLDASPLSVAPVRTRTSTRAGDRAVKSQDSKRDRPAIAVVIPVKRQSARLKASVELNRSAAPRDSSCEEDEEDNRRGEDSSFVDGDLLSGDCSDWDAQDPPRKRQIPRSPLKFAARASGSKEGSTVCGTCSSSVRPLSIPNTAAGANETQEIFGRAIVRIQPHGAQNAYFFTFLPNIINLQATVSPSPAPDMTSHSPGSRAQWTQAEDNRLAALKDASHSWPEIERQIPRRSTVSLKQQWSTLKARRASSTSHPATQMRKHKCTS
ncbi:hypothetical protein CISG_09203 [Coccidioides immitis RMSCC 3703]|uniref:Myb-like domain-containing protein n=1 Tax=Coccidioides immitis RMSCC 3703 TaxID=454286 RepID=A0A0J8RB27_COCIT|nr:hypothetical protein CISG_09203 [Coccidioides immitis RMSCC 3703]